MKQEELNLKLQRGSTLKMNFTGDNIVEIGEEIMEMVEEGEIGIGEELIVNLQGVRRHQLELLETIFMNDPEYRVLGKEVIGFEESNPHWGFRIKYFGKEDRENA